MHGGRVAQLEESLGPDRMAGKYLPVGDVRLEEHRKRLEWWVAEVQQCAEERRWLSLSMRQLQAAYARADGSVPKSAARVLTELERQGVLVRRDRLAGTGAVAAIASVLSSPFRWALGGGTDSHAREPTLDERFVRSQVLDAVALRVLRDVPHVLVTERALRTALAGHCPVAEDQELVREWLLQRGELAPLDPADGRGWRVGTREPSEVERMLFKLQCTLEALEAQEHELELRSARLRGDALAAAKTHRPKALELLRRKKAVDETLAKRLAVTTNVHRVLLALETTMADVAAFHALRDGNAALKTLADKSGLTVEAVETVLDEFAELSHRQAEVNELFADEANAGGGGVSMEDLEHELAALSVEEPAAAPVAVAPPSSSSVTPAAAAAPVKKKLVLE